MLLEPPHTFLKNPKTATLSLPSSSSQPANPTAALPHSHQQLRRCWSSKARSHPSPLLVVRPRHRRWSTAASLAIHPSSHHEHRCRPACPTHRCLAEATLFAVHKTLLIFVHILHLRHFQKRQCRSCCFEAMEEGNKYFDSWTKSHRGWEIEFTKPPLRCAA